MGGGGGGVGGGRLGVTVITLAFKGTRSPPSPHSGGDVSGYVPPRYLSEIAPDHRDTMYPDSE